MEAHSQLWYWRNKFVNINTMIKKTLVPSEGTTTQKKPKNQTKKNPPKKNTRRFRMQKLCLKLMKNFDPCWTAPLCNKAWVWVTFTSCPSFRGWTSEPDAEPCAVGMPAFHSHTASYYPQFSSSPQHVSSLVHQIGHVTAK